MFLIFNSYKNLNFVVSFVRTFATNSWFFLKSFNFQMHHPLGLQFFFSKNYFRYFCIKILSSFSKWKPRFRFVLRHQFYWKLNWNLNENLCFLKIKSVIELLTKKLTEAENEMIIKSALKRLKPISWSYKSVKVHQLYLFIFAFD